MTQEKVIEHLKSYKQCVGRCAHLEVEIQTVEQNLDFVLANIVDTEAYHVQQYEHMGLPRGTSVSDPTAAAATRIAMGCRTSVVDDIRSELAVLRREYEEVSRKVRYVEAWLSGLTEKDRWLIEQQVIEGKYWREIALMWQTKYDEPMSRDNIRRLKRMAIDKVYEMAG